MTKTNEHLIELTSEENPDYKDEIEMFLVDLLHDKSDMKEAELIITLEDGWKSSFKHIKPLEE